MLGPSIERESPTCPEQARSNPNTKNCYSKSQCSSEPMCWRAPFRGTARKHPKSHFGRTCCGKENIDLSASSESNTNGKEAPPCVLHLQKSRNSVPVMNSGGNQSGLTGGVSRSFTHRGAAPRGPEAAARRGPSPNNNTTLRFMRKLSSAADQRRSFHESPR